MRFPLWARANRGVLAARGWKRKSRLPYEGTPIYSPSVNMRWRTAAAALMAGILIVFGAGCGGVNAGGSVSPLMFLLPGVGQTKPVGAPPGVEPPSTNLVLAARSN